MKRVPQHHFYNKPHQPVELFFEWQSYSTLTGAYKPTNNRCRVSYKTCGRSAHIEIKELVSDMFLADSSNYQPTTVSRAPLTR